MRSALKRFKGFDVALILALWMVQGAFAQPTNSFAIRDVRIFDGERTLVRANLVVIAGRIAAVGMGAPIPAGLTTYDGSARTLIPGLIDSHVHIYGNAAADALRFGVTTELDMFDLAREFDRWRTQRESLAPTKNADIWAAGLGVTVSGGAPLNGAPAQLTASIPTLSAAAGARAFVDARVQEGSDYIKVFIENLSEYGSGRTLPTLTRAEVCAVIEASHADRRMAIVHAQAEWAAREAIECGADALAHMVPDQPLDANFIHLAKAHRIFVETTDSVWAAAAAGDEARRLAADPRVAPYLSASQKETLRSIEKSPVERFFTNALGNTRALHAAGVPLVAGTDAPNPGTAHGVSMHEELQLLVRAGYTPEDALRAATALPAALFHLNDRGRIRTGYRADLLLIRGDPTHAIGDTLAIERIWKNGYEVGRTVSQAALRNAACCGDNRKASRSRFRPASTG